MRKMMTALMGTLGCGGFALFAFLIPVLMVASLLGLLLDGINPGGDTSDWCDQYIADGSPNGLAPNCTYPVCLNQQGMAIDAHGDVGTFVNAYGAFAYTTGQTYNLPYQVILAQAALESAWGGSSLSSQYNNFFGIKVPASQLSTHPYVDLPTTEFVNGTYITVAGHFAVYRTIQEGWDGYGKFITGNSRYSNAYNMKTDPSSYLMTIWQDGYATDPNYYNKVWSLVLKFIDYIDTHGTTFVAGVAGTCISGPVPVFNGVSVQQAALDLLNNPHISFTGNSLDGRADLVLASTTGHAYACGSHGSNPNGPMLDAKLLWLINAATTQYNIQIGVLVAWHNCHTAGGAISQHSNGRAMDLNGVSALDGSGRTNFAGEDCTGTGCTFYSSSQPAFISSFAKYLDHIAYANHFTFELGQSQCGAFYQPMFTAARVFPDTCTHLHIDTA